MRKEISHLSLGERQILYTRHGNGEGFREIAEVLSQSDYGVSICGKKRLRIGDLELDLLVCSQSTCCVLSIRDRKPRYCWVQRNRSTSSNVALSELRQALLVERRETGSERASFSPRRQEPGGEKDLAEKQDVFRN